MKRWYQELPRRARWLIGILFVLVLLFGVVNGVLIADFFLRATFFS